MEMFQEFERKNNTDLGFNSVEDGWMGRDDESGGERL